MSHPPTMSHGPPTTSHGPPQRSRIASALILLLHHLDPTLDVAHFARHTPLKAGLRSSRDAAAFLAACSAEFGIALQAPETRDEALWALTGSAAAMYGHHVEGTGSAFAFADFIGARLEHEGKTYEADAYERLQEREGVKV